MRTKTIVIAMFFLFYTVSVVDTFVVALFFYVFIVSVVVRFYHAPSTANSARLKCDHETGFAVETHPSTLVVAAIACVVEQTFSYLCSDVRQYDNTRVEREVIILSFRFVLSKLVMPVTFMTESVEKGGPPRVARRTSTLL